MKKILFLGLCMVTLLCAGCGKKAKPADIEKKMDEYARDYYEKYGTMLVGDITEYEVTLGVLKDVNDSGDIDKKDKYDLKLFEDCKDSTKAIITLTDDQKIDSVKIKLNCKK